MLNILAVETSSQACSVALLQCNGIEPVVSQEYSESPRSHAQLALSMVDTVLDSAGLVLTDLDAIAFSAGPGSFTGLRIGLGLVQGLAFGAELPVIAVSALKTLAQGASETMQVTDQSVIIPCFDARMGENYWGVYRVVNGVVETVIADSLSSPERLAVDFSTENTIAGVGDGWAGSDQFPVAADVVDMKAQPQARYLAKLALLEFKAGNAVSVDESELVYLRDTVSWKKRQRLRMA